MSYRVKMQVRIPRVNGEDEICACLVFRYVPGFSPGEAIATAARSLPIEWAVDDATAAKQKEPT